jgi:hypothetical protein
VVHFVSKVDFTVYTFILLIVDTHNKENPAKPTESASDVSDSGVSVTVFTRMLHGKNLTRDIDLENQ